MAERLTSPSDQDEAPRNRLPTLTEVLSRRTLTPVDLFSFYIFMRDQQRSVDYLDFWLDVSQHLSLCRHYVRGLRRSVLVDTPDAEKALAASRHSSQLLDSFDLVDHPSVPSGSLPQGKAGDKSRTGDTGDNSELNQDRRLSQFLRSSDSSSSRSGSVTANHAHKRSNGTNSRQSHRSQQSQSSNPFAGGPSSAGAIHSNITETPETTPPNAVVRQDIRSSAEKILYTFLLAGSEREIVLPETLLTSITIAIEETGRDDPEIFDAAKDYVFAAMERDAFPGFLRAKALGNLVPPHLLLRLAIGLLALFGGFWAAFCLIFLDRSRLQRCWLILPFAIGIYCLASHQYTLDPVLAITGYSEYTFFSLTRIREPFVRKLLAKRGIVALWWVIGLTAALSCLFIFVPGTRL